MSDGNVFERRTSYQAAAGADKVIKAGPAYLHSIIVGENVSGGIIEVSNSATDGDGDVQIYLKSVLTGTYEVGAYFSKGIAVDMTGAQIQVTFVYS